MAFDNAYIVQDLQKCYRELGSFVSGDRVILPKLNIGIKPEVYQMEEHLATIGYHIYSPEWKNELFDISSAFGSDSKMAVGMAQGSFMFGMMETVQAMINDVNARQVDSDFMGLHRWKLYLGNIVAVNKEAAVNDIEMYWNVLKEELLDRIGNQEICCIKIYAANGGDGKFITGECRINDNRLESLSEIVKDMAGTWKNEKFASHKQFFLLKQEKETLKENPYTNAEIYDAVEKSLRLYEKVTEDGRQDLYLQVLAEYLKDRTLAQDIYNFVPEVCAELAIESVRFSEKVQLNLRGHILPFYKTQLGAYYPIRNGVIRVLDGDMLNNTQKVFESLLYASAVFHAVSHAVNDGSRQEDLILADTVLNVTDDYIVR